MSPNLLVQRIRSLVGDGLVARNEAPTRSRAVKYRLTDAGRDLEPVLFELIRWGGRWIATGPGDGHIEPAWIVLAARALLDGAHTGARAGLVHVHADGEWRTLTMRAGRLGAAAGRHGEADATVSIGFPELVAIASGQQPLNHPKNVLCRVTAGWPERRWRFGCASAPDSSFLLGILARRPTRRADPRRGA